MAEIKLIHKDTIIPKVKPLDWDVEIKKIRDRTEEFIMMK